ncbi:CREB3 regulatory factor-like [Protopterus annectens]|uniref:CREB3 regulatory factor-like n=1 Tax=Protopterus annectens TaxID=7888 RepID=UPI001CFC2277|nr:CREB3 regulatory factor-like [Protopterus annectens]
MPQPGTSGMEPAFGDAYRNCRHSEQRVTATAETSAEDSGYDQDRILNSAHGTRQDHLLVGAYRSPKKENIELLSDLLDDEPCDPNKCERWDISALEEFAQYTKTDQWTENANETPLLGISSGPFVKEEERPWVSTLCSLSQEHIPLPNDTICVLKREASGAISRNLQAPKLNSFLEHHSDSYTEVRLVASGKHCNSYSRFEREPRDETCSATLLKKSLVRDANKSSLQAFNEGAFGHTVLYSQDSLRSQHCHPVIKMCDVGSIKVETFSDDEEKPGAWRSVNDYGRTLARGSTESQCELTNEEHNYSMFSSAESLGPMAAVNDVDASGSESSSTSEQEESENDLTEDEDEYDEYEDRNVEEGSGSSNVSESDCDPSVEPDSQIQGKRPKRCYFWEYSSSHASPCKKSRTSSTPQWTCYTLPSNKYQKETCSLTGRRILKKSRRTDVNDLTPNPRKLLYIGEELKKLNKVIDDLTPASALPVVARPRSRKEKNKLASRACRLKKKAQHEANKLKLWGLNMEHDGLLQVLVTIKQEIVKRVGNNCTSEREKMSEKLERLLKEKEGPQVAGQTSEFVQKVLQAVAAGDPTGGIGKLGVLSSRN